MKQVSLRDDAIMLANLIGRNLKLFLKDGMSVFFSLLSPLIILILYILFLRDVQMDAVLGAFGNAPVDRELLETFVDNWMLAGVISVACVTVSFSAQSITIKDREDGILADLMAAPVKRGVLSAAYLISNLLITVSICAFVLAVSFVFAAGGEWTLSVEDAFSIIGWMMLSAAGAATLSTLICGALKTSAQHGAATGIMSAAIGFLMGAYMPLSIFPKAVQYVALFLPGTYSASVFRNLYMEGALNKIAAQLPGVEEALEDQFSMTLNFFGETIGDDVQAGIFAGIFVLTVLIWGAKEGVAAIRRKKSEAQPNSRTETSDRTNDNRG